MGTSLSEVFLDFEMNMTGTRLTGRETMIFQAFKRSVALCAKIVHKSLDFSLDNQTFHFKLYNISNIDDKIVFSINDKTYSVITSVSDATESLLNLILSEIINDYPLSLIKQDADTVIVKSETSLDIKLIDTGNHAIILYPEYSGNFLFDLGQDEISLIAMGMTKEWYNMQHSKVLLERNNMGTKHFDKDPDRKKQYESMIERSNYWNLEFLRYRQEFYTFGH